MNRCAWARVCALALLLPLGLAHAQVRNFPASALRGHLEMVQAPEVRINDETTRLSPGARIRDTNNFIVMPNSLLGKVWTVNYTREMNGLVHEVWILTPQEAALERPHEGTIRNFRFASELPEAQ